MANNVKGLTIELSLDATKLKSGIEKTKKELSEEEKELAKINKALKFDPSSMDNLKKKAASLNTVIENLRKNIEKQKAVVEQLQKLKDTDGSKYSANLKAETKTLQAMNGELEKYEAQLKQVETSQKRLASESFDKLASGLSKVSAVITASATAIFAGVNKAASSINDINQSASKAGMAIDEYQRLAYAFAQVGASSETFTQSISKVNTVLGNVALGKTSNYSKVFKQLGIDMKTFSKLSTTDAFNTIIDALGKVEDKAERAGYAATIFGSELATKLDPIIQAGSSSLEQWGSEAKVVSQETAQLAIQNENLREKIKNLGLNAIASLLPTINKALEKIASVMESKIIPAVQNLVNWFNNLSSVQKNMLGLIAGLAVALGPLLAIGSKLVKLFAAKNIAVLASSIGPVVAGVVAAAAAVALMWKNSEKLRSSVKGFVGQLGETLKPLLDSIVESFKSFYPILESVTKFLGDSLSWTFDALSKLLQFFQPIFNGISKIMKPIQDFMQSSFASFLQWIIDKLDQLFGLIDKIGNKISEIFDGNGDEFDKLMDKLDPNYTSPSKIPSFANRQTADTDTGGNEYVRGGNTYYVTINTTADHMSLDEIDEQLAVKIL